MQLRLAKGSQIQSILIPRGRYSLAEARAWVRSHGYRATKVDITETYYRFRQAEPSRFSRMRTKSAGKGIKLIVGFA